MCRTTVTAVLLIVFTVITAWGQSPLSYNGNATDVLTGTPSYTTVRIGVNAGSLSTIVDATGTTSFTSNGTEFFVGVSTGSGTGVGRLNLGPNNSITATQVTIGGLQPDSNSQAGNTGLVTTPASSSTSFAATNFAVGTGKGTGTFTLGSNATLSIGSTGARTAMVIGRWSSFNSHSGNGTMNLGNGSASLYLNSLALASITSSSGGSGSQCTGSMTLSANTANHLDISGPGSVVTIGSNNQPSGNAQAATGTLTINNLSATSVVTSTDNATAILIASRAGTATNNATGTLNLNGGTLTITTSGSAIAGGGGPSTLTIDGGFVLKAGASSSDWINSLTTATINAGGATIDTNGFDLGVSQAFSGAGGLTKAGTGTLTLSGTRSYAGGTTVQAGTLVLAGAGAAGTVSVSGTAQLNIDAANALGDSSGSLALSSGATLDNTSGLDVTVNSSPPITLGSTLNFVGTNNLNLGGGAATLSGPTTISVSAGTLGFGGDLVGSGASLVKTGAGVLELGGLTGSGTFTGNTDIQGGEIYLTGTSAFSSTGLVNIGQNGILRVGPSATVDLGNVTGFSDNLIAEQGVQGNFEYQTSQTLTRNTNILGQSIIDTGVTVTMATDYLGATVGDAGPRIVMRGGSTLKSTGTVSIPSTKPVDLVSGEATFESAGNGPLTIDSVISGSGALVKTGAGGFRVLGANTYSGGTIAREGSFGINSDASLGLAGTTLLLDGGTVNSAQDNTAVEIASTRPIRLANNKTSGLRANPGGTLTYAGIIAEDFPAGLAANLVINDATKSGNGTVIFGGANTYRGTTLVDAGTFKLAAGGSIASSAGISVKSGAFFDVADVTGGFTLASGQSIGGLGTVLGSMLFGAGSKFDFTSQETLLVNSGTVSFAAFSIADVLGLSSTTPEGIYTLMGGTASFDLSGGIDNVGFGNAYDLGDGKSAYFQQGSLQVVVTAVPEPATFGLVTAAGAAWGALARRRARNR